MIGVEGGMKGRDKDLLYDVHSALSLAVSLAYKVEEGREGVLVLTRAATNHVSALLDVAVREGAVPLGAGAVPFGAGASSGK